MNDQLRKRVRVGLLWDLAGRFTGQLGSLVVSIVLARLLDPAEFGVVGMAMVFIAISQVFVDVGFTDGLIQRKTINQRMLSSVFYISSGIGLIIGITILISSPFIGEFYGNADVAVVLRYLSVVPLLGALGSVHRALLTRDLKFKDINFSIVGGTVIGGIFGVIFAYKGFGVYALVIQQLVTNIIRVLVLWHRQYWIPELSFDLKEVKTLMGFSGYVFLDQALRQFFQKLDTLFIGKVFTAATLGFYSRAESLNAQAVTYLGTSLRSVIFPVFSSIQDNKERFIRNLYKVINVVVIGCVLAVGVLYFLSEEIIVGLLGKKWRPSVVIFQVLAFKMLIVPIEGILGRSVLAMGMAKRKFRLNQIHRLLLLIPLAIGYYYGLIWLVLGHVVFYFVGFCIKTAFYSFYLDFSLKKILYIVLPPLIPLVIWVVLEKLFLSTINSWVLLLLFSSSLLLLLLTFRHEGLKLIIEEIRIMIKGKVQAKKSINTKG